ncbi:MAG: thiamine pyrophosphate central protein [Mycobacterium sp.]|jgi:thiamine pyrophosphate-dependent acetolactate synthase large subunit-like protein|nr:thiamine pyrophosphate central protein [Mycobacterium sp.]
MDFNRLLAEAAAAMDGSAPRPALPVRPLAPDEPLVADFVLAGAAVVQGGYAAALAAFAEHTGLGVLNAFTAKGLFRWDSPFHLGTGCLQERDLQLAGAGPDSVVLVVGVDIDECNPALMAAAGLDAVPAAWRSVEPSGLAAAAAQVTASWGGPPAPPPQPELFKVLWDVAQPLYALESGPLNPARAAADIATALGADGVVCAEPGPAGWWIGRTVPTTRLGSVAIPASGSPGVAVARALLTAQAGSPALAVVDALGPEALALIELGRQLEFPFVVEVWGDAGARLDAAAHRDRVEAALASPGVTVIELPIDYAATEQLIAAAGALVAWS